MYLPSCTYYVSGPDFSSLPSFLPQTPSSRPMTYSYSSNLPQVQPVREVTFREYAIEPATKWHPRGNLTHCYSAEELVHRDCLQAPSAAGVPGDVLAKSSAGVYHHPTPAVSSNFYSTVGRNGVLPQAFDQFFETAYGTPENLASSDYPGDKSAEKGPPAAAATSTAAAAAAATGAPATSSSDGSSGCREAAAEEKERRRHPESSSSPESSSGHTEDKAGGSSTSQDRQLDPARGQLRAGEPEVGACGQRTRKKRCPYTKYQIRELEREFFFSVYINKEKRLQLSRMLNLTDRQLELGPGLGARWPRDGALQINVKAAGEPGTPARFLAFVRF
ncbi:Homeobox protein Hox-A11 [Galemys pyrenaicus]|uniref:Homeobox protein Hox-A11 n=1 Tax=Galemys pyrenaicus TaxID=202257 RepID=A0A8J6DNJ2_GALPY|nr:Homeobox protein Hox-A11 [Galemys pyrenaicus]